MRQIDNIGQQANQITNVTLPDGTIVDVELIYMPAVQRWIMNVTWAPRFLARGINLCVGANLLREWRNKLPFGILCATTDSADPFDVQDFSSGRAALYLLDAADVEAVEGLIAEAAA